MGGESTEEEFFINQVSLALNVQFTSLEWGIFHLPSYVD